jgi:hypothetical protein
MSEGGCSKPHKIKKSLTLEPLKTDKSKETTRTAISKLRVLQCSPGRLKDTLRYNN